MKAPATGALVRTWTALLVLSLTGCACDAEERPPRDPSDCRHWVDRVPAVPELTLGPERPLSEAVTKVCLSSDAIFVGRARVPFSPARAGEALSAGLMATLPRSPRAVDLWAPASRPAGDVVLVARAFSRAGVQVRLVGRRAGAAQRIARIDPPRTDAIPRAAGIVPDAVDVWVELAPDGSVVRTTEGAHIPIEGDSRDARWIALTEALREQRHVDPERRRLVFAPEGTVTYAEWAHALAIATSEGFESIELTPVGALEALSYEIGPALAGLHWLPIEDRVPAVMPSEYAADPEGVFLPPIRSRIEVGSLDVGGYLDAAAVEQVVREHVRDLAFCHERAPNADRELEGRLALSAIVGASGRVQSVGVRAADEPSRLRNDAMLRCLRAQVAEWTFTPSRTGETTGIRVLLTLRASDR